MEIDALFTPAEFRTLQPGALEKTTCVVFDVLRATTTMVTALARGARSVRPVATIEEALEERRRDPAALLAGERGGLRIGKELGQGTGFDLGNSPREFTADRVAGRRIIMTTTNGTLALRACAGALAVFPAGLVNLFAATEAAWDTGAERVLLVCGGTGEGAAYEDAVAAGGMAAILEGLGGRLLDGALLAAAAWATAGDDLGAAIRRSSNARRLLAHPELAPDVELCLRRDVYARAPRRREGGDYA